RVLVDDERAFHRAVNLPAPAHADVARQGGQRWFDVETRLGERGDGGSGVEHVVPGRDGQFDVQPPAARAVDREGAAALRHHQVGDVEVGRGVETVGHAAGVVAEHGAQPGPVGAVDQAPGGRGEAPGGAFQVGEAGVIVAALVVLAGD